MESTNSPGAGTGAGGLITDPGLSSSTGKAGIGPPGACRFGSSCSSQGTSGRCGIGMLPPSGGGPGRTRLPGAVAPAWKNWLLPSERRLSPDRPGKPRWSCERTSWLLFSASLPVSGFGILRCMNGTSTLLVQAESARFSRRNGTEVRLNATTSGIVCRSTRAVPRSSSSDISRRAWVMNGSDASSVSSDERTPGSASRANARSDGSAESSEASAGWPTRSVSRSAGIDAASAASSRAKAAAVTLKLVTRSFRARSSRTSAPKVFCWPFRTRWRSRSASWPSVASLASEELR